MVVSAVDRGVAAGWIGELHQHRHEHAAAPRRPAEWPHQVGVIPQRADCFQDRAETVRLRQALAAVGTAVVESANGMPTGGVLAGMGGVGKTQLAADYARTAWQTGELDILIWISAASRSAVVAGYAQAATELLAADPADPQTAAAALLAWLAPAPRQRGCRWLVVLDDVADPADLTGLWPPASPTGRTLVTARRKDAALTGRGRCLIEVGLFTPAEALAYLTDALAAHHRREPAEQLAALANDLGYLPLALSQAAAYLIDAALSCEQYRALLADRATRLADAAPDALPDGQTHTMAAAWGLSIDRADTLRPAGLARPMLHLAAFLDPNGIPAQVLTSAPAVEHLAHHLGNGQETPAAPAARALRTLHRALAHRRSQGPGTRGITLPQAAQALRALYRLSLIEHTPDTPHQAVRVHQLVQRAVRDALSPDQQRHLARTAADALIAAWPKVERDTGLAVVLRANTAALTACAEEALYQPSAHPVLYQAGNSLGRSGQDAAARDHFQHLTAETGRRFGPDHLDSLTTRHNLAQWRGEAGDAAGAAAAFAELLDDAVLVLGPDHLATLSTRSGLARWRGEAGDAAGAAAAFAELLDHMLRVLGPDHAVTLTARVQLARWRGEAGDAAEAAAALAELLDHMLRVLGPDHPDTLATRINLAYWRGKAGNAAEAAVAYADLLPDVLRVLGPDHPTTLTTRNNLAYWRGKAGNAAEAAVAYAELLTDRMRVLGPDHPDTLATRINLVCSQGEAGDAAEAAAALADLLPDVLRVLGPDHPTTLTARNNLACWRGEAGDAAEAAVAYAELLTDRMRVLGPDHPDTLTTRHDGAHWQGMAGDAAGAATAFADLLPDIVRVLGPDHPTTLTARGALARWLEEAGNGSQGDCAK